MNTDAHLREYLFSLAHFGIKLGLHNITAMLAADNNPHLRYPVLHVAGTNGKGSAIAFLDAMLGAAGYKTGRFTSPHLVEVNERFLVDRTPIADGALDSHTAHFRALCEAHSLSPTFFEMTTAIAFRHFAQESVDIALVEVGMGGRLDSTNVVSPALCAITNIDFDHTEHLGNTIPEIAGEKAGIIKPGVPVVTTETAPEALAVFAQHAEKLGCELDRIGQQFTCALGGTAWAPMFSYTSDAFSLEKVRLNLLGKHQAHNAALAVRCAERLRGQFPKLDTTAIRYGLENAVWPCRLERVCAEPPVYIDVAHNPAGARRISEVFERCVCVLAVSSDKDARAMLDALAPCATVFLLTAYNDKRAMPIEQLAALAGDKPCEAHPNLDTAIGRGLQLADSETPLLITGSIYTAGEARQLLIQNNKADSIRFG